MSLEALSGYGSKDNEDIKISNKSLTVPDSWSVIEKAKLNGISGFTHVIDLLAESSGGKRIGILFVTEDEASLYEALGRIQIMKNDLNVPLRLVICVPDQMVNVATSLAVSPEILIVNEIRYRNARINKSDSSVTKANSKNSSDYMRKERVKRDRMKIMLDVLNLLQNQDSRITNIIYRCNLNYRMASDLLEEMIRKNYVQVIRNRNDPPAYAVTKDGEEALKTARKLYGSI
ncbi:MAG: winged helix-turn-helix domain-containing protein [Thermoplasmataceae archaeon]